MADNEFLYKDLTYAAIGAAMEVHKVLGPGFLESVYETALAHELDLRNIAHRRQPDVAVTYKGTLAGEFRADTIVVDPPRKGLAPEVRAALAESAAG